MKSIQFATVMKGTLLMSRLSVNSFIYSSAATELTLSIAAAGVLLTTFSRSSTASSGVIGYFQTNYFIGITEMLDKLINFLT